MKDFAVYTVCTGHYKYGLFAMIDSLREHGYSGDILVATDKGYDELKGQQGVKQVIIDSKHVFGNLKARLILDNPAKEFLFLDPDCIQSHPDMITIVRDLLTRFGRFIVSAEGIVPDTHVKRLEWNNILGSTIQPHHNWYYGAGFFAGSFKAHSPILEKWDHWIMKLFKPGDYFHGHRVFPLADQDLLNAVLQTYSIDDLLNIGMPDWISTAIKQSPFHPFNLYKGPLYIHATGITKPWVLKKIPKREPNAYETLFYRYHTQSKISFQPVKMSFWLRHWFRKGRLSPVLIKLAN